MADTKRPTDQGVLAMYSMAADIFLSTLSGLLVLVTGVWITGTSSDKVTGTLMYHVFKDHSPFFFGKYVLLITVALFVITTVIGNSFNGRQSYAYFTQHRFMDFYHAAIAFVIFAGAIAHVPLVWALADILLAFVAVPHLIGLVALVFKQPEVLEL